MKKSTKAKATPASSASVPAKKKTAAVSSAKVTSPKVAAAAASALAPAPAPQVKKTSSAAPQPKPTILKIKAQIDIGFGNMLTIRGTGAGLSWDKGLAMNCVNDDLWSVTLVGVSEPIAFKFLVNDLTWSAGEDYTAQPGDELLLEPAF